MRPGVDMGVLSFLGTLSFLLSAGAGGGETGFTGVNSSSFLRFHIGDEILLPALAAGTNLSYYFRQWFILREFQVARYPVSLNPAPKLKKQYTSLRWSVGGPAAPWVLTIYSGLVLQQRLEDVERRIDRAAARAGRGREAITLVAVTKKFPASVIREAHQLGLRHFGENYVQEFEQKVLELADLATDATFHLIGHLQSNKAKKASELFAWIQTIDSVRLAQRLEQSGKPLDVMVEVKLSEEEAKRGAGANDLPEIVDYLRASTLLKLRGLMTMPPWSDNGEDSRPYFRRLKELAVQFALPCLSMGMSHDLEAAIEEGSTHVRVGTALFGPRPKP
jgi:pyridoxal phosphate enzyme (YggS family)